MHSARPARLADETLAAVLGAGLFVAAFVPWLFVRQPPLQDYAEHVAAAAIAGHLGDYPEYLFNGLLKTNSAFVTFTWLVGKAIGVERAGFLFAALVLAVNAFVLPRFVLRFGGRARMRVAALFALPFVHNWFVSMGMLNFSLGVSLSLLMLVALDRHAVAPSWGRGARAAALGLATWYAHAVPVLAVGLLAAVRIASRRTGSERKADAGALLPPVAPAALAVVVSTVVHLRGTVRPAGAGGATSFQSPLWLVYDLWAHWTYGYTILSVTSLVLAGVLAVFAVHAARDDVPFFGPWAMGLLIALYLVAPYQTVGIGYAGSRILPYVWMGALLRVPERIGTGLGALLGLCTALYAAGMAIDTVRLAREEDEVASGVDVVPAGARLDFLDFSPRVTSRNTWSLSTAWGEYVTRRGAHTWEMPGDTPSLPFRWRDRPPAPLEPWRHRMFMDSAPSREQWATYFADVDPYVDALVLWDPPAACVEGIPRAWALATHRGRLWVFVRSGDQGSSRTSTSTRRPGPVPAGRAKNAEPTSPAKLPPLRANTSPCRPSWTSSRPTRAVIRRRVTGPTAVSSRGRSMASVRSMPRRRAVDGDPSMAVLESRPVSSITKDTVADPAAPNGACAQTESVHAA